MKLLGKIAVITGASSGMGRAMALEFAKEGATVIAVARRKERLDEIVKEAYEFEGQIIAFKGDISNKEDVSNMLNMALSDYGKLDILVNNAGVMDDMVPVGEVTDELWDRVMDVNLRGPFYACRKAVNIMMSQGHGNIINTASIGGLNGGRAGAAYTASKYAIVGLSKNIAYMYAKNGIRCNTICPGAVDSEIGVGMKNPSEFGMGRTQAGMASLPRSGSADEIAKIALFLASDDSSFINGADIVADAGWTAL
ncbi:MAG: glucose 1-dehydrogenase [Clostridioides sp.]|jgi:NAD(P)-dependent dehydrogenase (short-subunit alcohol dehydrogenase family)|nr:glucose 1-dehydrogenase [Clostridioides sp.]